MSKRFEIWGNEATMNMESTLLVNIQSSHYFKELYRLKAFTDVVDEIYSEVKTLEPWFNVSRKTPSTAFCLLLKLHTLRPTYAQVKMLLNHRDSVFIRGLGFLYLRYLCPPKNLWSWIENYVYDETEIKLSPKTPPKQIGKWARELLVDIRFFETIFPRIPIPIMKEIEKKLKECEEEEREWERQQKLESKDRSRSRSKSISPIRKSRERRSRSRDKRSGSRDRRSRSKDRSRERYRSTSRDRYRKRSRSRDRYRRDRSRSPRRRSRSPRRRSSRSPRYRSRSRDRSRRNRSFERSRKRSKSRSPRSRSASPERSKTSEPEKPKEKAKPSAEFEKIKAMYGGTTYLKEVIEPIRNKAGTSEETIILGKKK